MAFRLSSAFLSTFKGFLLIIFLLFLKNLWAEPHIVGSSTLFPILSAVADHFYFKGLGVPPVIESTGTGGGIKLFCNKGKDIPLMVAASRPMSALEIELCKKNGHQEILELDLGSDGMVLVSPVRENVFNLSLNDLKRALSSEEGQPFLWSDLNKNYPSQAIKIMGAPSTAGTYEALLQSLNLKSFRQDGGYVAASDQESVLVQKLTIESEALGVVSFGFLLKNPSLIFPCPIDGVRPSVAAIRQGTYPLSRRLYLYVHGDQIESLPFMQDFLNFLTSPSMIEEKGLFEFFGLIAHEKSHYEQFRAQWNKGAQ